MTADVAGMELHASRSMHKSQDTPNTTDDCCSSMELGMNCTDCSMTCASYSNIFYPPTSLTATKPRGESVNIRLAMETLASHNFKILRPPIS